jgi:hypothetical protein
MARSFLSIEQLTQQFPDGAGGTMTVFENATFGVEKGEFVCILGHSGCGVHNHEYPRWFGRTDQWRGTNGWLTCLWSQP